MIYVYPAVFDEAEEGGYNVHFPDISGCLTCGNDLKEAIEMADDALNLMLWSFEYDGIDIPPASDINDIPKPEHGFVSYVLADTEAYSAVMVRENPNETFDLSRIKPSPKSA